LGGLVAPQVAIAASIPDTKVIIVAATSRNSPSLRLSWLRSSHMTLPVRNGLW
jgi:hypothetical protein